jgi:hypothetical protein
LIQQLLVAEELDEEEPTVPDLDTRIEEIVLRTLRRLGQSR